MQVAVDEISTGSITNRHHCKGGDEEEGENAQGAVTHELHPQVAHLHGLSGGSIHHHALLTLCEAEEEQAEADNGVDRHRGEPCTRVFRKTVRGSTSDQGDEQGQTRVNGQTTEIGHEHTYRGEDGYLVCVASQR